MPVQLEISSTTLKLSRAAVTNGTGAMPLSLVPVLEQTNRQAKDEAVYQEDWTKRNMGQKLTLLSYSI